MTKKSSFLRQLNLYGFNRLSAAGPNQGSYYHEKFLRGMKFLCRRMQRQKVNGNGIRAAGNPDEEPNLNLYPSCPPMMRAFPGQQCVSSLIAPPPPPPPPVATTVVAMAREIARPNKSATAGGGGGGSYGGYTSNPASPRLKPDSANKASKNSGGNDDPSDASYEHESRRGDNSANASGSSSPVHPNSASGGGASAGVPGQQVSFPLKLQCILDKLEADGTTSIIR